MFAQMQNMQRTCKIRTTCLEMLRDRGYLVDTTSTHGESTTILVAKPNPKTSKDRVLVVFAQEGKTGVHSIKAVAEQMRDAGADRAIFVSPTPLTAFAKAAVAEVASKFTIEPFLEQELLFNVTHHVLVPTHQVLSKEDKQHLLNRYQIEDKHLPRILQRDPVARYYGMAKGQVARITRDSETAGTYVTYRLCT